MISRRLNLREIFLLSLNIIFAGLLLGQVNTPETCPIKKWSANVHFSNVIGSSRAGVSEWSFSGTSLTKYHFFNDHWGLITSLSYDRFTSFDKSQIPFQLGPAVNIGPCNRWRWTVFFSAGPALIWGKDYGSVFALYSAGTKWFLPVTQGFDLVLGMRFGQGMAFHPSPYEYWSLSAGLAF